MKGDLNSTPSGRTVEELLEILSEVQFWGISVSESAEADHMPRPADSGPSEEIS
ncbi:MAG: hypothetical protein ACKO3B_08855 [Bacteroidota bacterium]